VNSFARVAVPRPLHQTFLYRVPDSLEREVEPGCRVVVPFGRKQLVGWVDKLDPEPEKPPASVRDILDVPDSEPVLSLELLELCRWVSRYYVAPIGLTFRAALPARLTSESAQRIRLAEAGAEGSTVSERTLVELLGRHKGPVKLSSVRKTLGPGPWSQAAERLAQRGLLAIEQEAPETGRPTRSRQVVSLVREMPTLQERDRILGRARRQRELYEYLESVGGQAEVAHITDRLQVSRSVVAGLVEKALVTIHTEASPYDLFDEVPTEEEPRHTPTQAQASVIRKLLAASRGSPPKACLLKGVTSSGKTLVYIELLRELVVGQGKGALVLVPEISLTPQTLGRFRAAFGDDVALLHSALSDGERYAAWQALRVGEKRIVIGARSAVFAPVQNLGAIIMDEEHEGTYKQSDPAPRYHARDVAVVRARRADALCVFGSATPSLESWWNAKAGAWELLELPERIGSRPLPSVRIVDMREERKAPRPSTDGGPKGPLVLSASLRNALEERLRKGEQSILLLNRRGYSTFVQCRDCGAVLNCWRCNVSLTHHRRPPRLVCHHCNHQEPVPSACPACSSTELNRSGVGTEQVERVLGETFAEARIARMDVDTTSGKWSHHEILGRVERGEVDILLGTQMIAKGLDFPSVTLVGVINADIGLNLPDFRASERTFQLLTQVAGRAGRGPAGGSVIVQTSLPGHYAVRFAISHDYEGFTARELEERSSPAYPPHIRLANLVFSGPNELRVQGAAESALQWLDGLLEARGIDGVALVGPAPCPIDRIRSRWRWHLLLKAQSGDTLGPVLRYLADKFTLSGADLRMEIDRDPVNLL
jgi:primosomal protein N' (replication factor Y)